MTNTVLKAQIDSQITNETTPLGITPTEVGENLKAVVNYVDQEVSGFAGVVKTQGSVEATNISEFPYLSFDLNMVNTTDVSQKVVLPITDVIGKEVLVFALNNGASFSVRGDQAGSAVLSPAGVSSYSTNVSVAANASYRFIHLGGGYWKSSLI